MGWVLVGWDEMGWDEMGWDEMRQGEEGLVVEVDVRVPKRLARGRRHLRAVAPLRVERTTAREGDHHICVERAVVGTWRQVAAQTRCDHGT
jgi:hypothetical protein